MTPKTFEKLSQAEQCAYYLIQTLLDENSALRKESEKELTKLQENKTKFTELVLSVLTSPDSESNSRLS